MKFVILLAIFGFVAVSAISTTTEELEKKAIELEAKLEAEIERVKTKNPVSAIILQKKIQMLKSWAGELAAAKEPSIITNLEQRLRLLERMFENSLRRTDGYSQTPVIRKTTVSTRLSTLTTTLSPLQMKNLLLKRAAQLELNAKSEITRLQKHNRTAQILAVQALDSEVIRISERLQKTTQLELLQLLDSELFWLESRLSVEIDSLQAQDKRFDKLFAIYGALKQRIVSALNVIGNTPVGNALTGESKKLDALMISLANAKDDKHIDDIEMQLTSIEKRVNDELRVIVVPTVKPF